MSVGTGADGVQTLVAGKVIPAGSFVAVVAPNLLVKAAEVTNPSQAYQVGPDLFSVGFWPEDLTNFIGRSATPNLTGIVGDNFAVELTAARDIPAGEPLTVDAAQFGGASK